MKIVPKYVSQPHKNTNSHIINTALLSLLNTNASNRPENTFNPCRLLQPNEFANPLTSFYLRKPRHRGIKPLVVVTPFLCINPSKKAAPTFSLFLSPITPGFLCRIPFYKLKLKIATVCVCVCMHMLQVCLFVFHFFNPQPKIFFPLIF